MLICSHPSGNISLGKQTRKRNRKTVPYINIHFTLTLLIMNDIPLTTERILSDNDNKVFISAKILPIQLNQILKNN